MRYQPVRCHARMRRKGVISMPCMQEMHCARRANNGFKQQYETVPFLKRCASHAGRAQLSKFNRALTQAATIAAAA